MATVTKPIALDESLNTTELSSRNVADVLAQELSAVATAIGGITHPDAEDIAYDNSVSGLSATDVQNALDEIVSDIPTVNNGTLTIQQNGTSIGSFSANTASNVTANIKTPTADKKTATSEFSTADGGLLSKCVIDLEPVQSGSGDPSPDNVRPISGHTEVDLYNVGKNLLPMTVAGIKSVNTSGTWSGNTYTLNNVSFVIQTDSSGNVTGIKVNGTASANTTFTLQTSSNLGNASYIINGCPIGGGNDTYRITVYYGSTYAFDTGSGVGIAVPSGSTIGNVNIRIGSGTVVSNKTFYPMLRLSTESDPTFEPYLGHLYQVQIGSTVYGGYVDLVSGVMVATHAFMTFDGTENWQIGSGNAYLGIVGMKSGNNQWGLCSILPRGTESGCIRFGFTNTRIYIMDCVTAYELDTATKVKAFMNGAEIVYPLDTPLTIQLTPQQIEALVGQNNLSTPLDGQSIETNGVEYKELFTWDDVQSLINNDYASSNTTYSSSFIETKFALKYDLPLISSKVVKASGSTSVTFSHERIFSADQTYCELLQYGSGDRVVVSDVSVTTGSVTFTFASATTQSITFRCRISNVLIG